MAAWSYLQDVTRHRLWSLTRCYRFDALVLVGVGVGLAEVTVTRHHKNGPLGPLWFDLLAILAITLPLYVRRRFPFGAPVTVGVAIASASFVDGRLIPNGLVTILVSISAFVPPPN